MQVQKQIIHLTVAAPHAAHGSASMTSDRHILLNCTKPAHKRASPTCCQQEPTGTYSQGPFPPAEIPVGVDFLSSTKPTADGQRRQPASTPCMRVDSTCSNNPQLEEDMRMASMARSTAACCQPPPATKTARAAARGYKRPATRGCFSSWAGLSPSVPLFLPSSSSGVSSSSASFLLFLHSLAPSSRSLVVLHPCSSDRISPSLSNIPQQLARANHSLLFFISLYLFLSPRASLFLSVSTAATTVHRNHTLPSASSHSSQLEQQ